jgi:hypothetical protein
MANNKRGGTIQKRKSIIALSSERPDKKTKPTLGMTLDLVQAEKVRAEMNREDDDKLFLQRQRKQNEEDIKQGKVKKTYLSPFRKDKYEHTTHDQTKSTPKKLFEEWQAEEELGEYADASEAGVTMSALRPEHTSSRKSIKNSNPKNLFKGGRDSGRDDDRLSNEWIEHILHFYYVQEDISDKISRDDLKEILKKLKYDKDYISPITGEPIKSFGYQAMAKVDAFYKYGGHIGGKRKSRKSKRKTKKSKRKTRKTRRK